MYWVARDKYAVRCKLFARKPKRWSCYWSDAGYNNAYENVLLLLDSDSFPDLKWEDEPLEVELKEIISKDDTSQKMIYRNFIYNDVVIKGTTEKESLRGENVYTIINPEVLELLHITILEPSNRYKFKIDEIYIDCEDKECDEDGYLVFQSKYKHCIFMKEGDDIKMYCPSFDREICNYKKEGEESYSSSSFSSPFDIERFRDAYDEVELRMLNGLYIKNEKV